jgi:ABC-2 type transport system ATP-binding protein
MLLLRLKEKQKTIIITSHIIETLTNLCDFIHYLEQGTIKYTKARDEFALFEKEIFKNIEHAHMDFINKLTK